MTVRRMQNDSNPRFFLNVLRAKRAEPQYSAHTFFKSARPVSETAGKLAWVHQQRDWIFSLTMFLNYLSFSEITTDSVIDSRHYKL